MSTFDEKLVRDRIPDLMREHGLSPHVRTVSGKELSHFLLKKLCEEADECASTPTIEELADVSEVLEALLESLGISTGMLHEARRSKSERNGAFKLGFVLRV